jgi:hypothetical protein
MSATKKTVGFIYCVWYTISHCFKLGFGVCPEKRFKTAQTWATEPIILKFKVPAMFEDEQRVQRKLKRRGYLKPHCKGKEVYWISDSWVVTKAKLDEVIGLAQQEEIWDQQTFGFEREVA